MTLAVPEIIQRFLMHVLPNRFHRIRHYGFLSNKVRAVQLQKVRDALNVKAPEPDESEDSDSIDERLICKRCAGIMQLIEAYEGTFRARAPPLEVAV